MSSIEFAASRPAEPSSTEVGPDGTDGPPDVGELVRVGPFVAASQRFVIDSNDAGMAAGLADRLRDLRVDGAHAGGDDVTVFLVVRRGPDWVTHPWGVWRDGEPCETTVSDSYISPYVLWEVTRLVLERAHPLIPVHAAAVARGGRALVLAGRSHAGKSTLAGWLTAHGWSFLTDEVALLELGQDGLTLVHPFWRPIGVRRPGPLDHLIDVPNTNPEVLIPASELGTLGPAAPLAAIVFPRYVEGAESSVRPETPAASVRELSLHLPTLGVRGRAVFRSIVEVVTATPAFQIDVDDLSMASSTLERLLEVGGRP
jgi:hypothetical protein